MKSESKITLTENQKEVLKHIKKFVFESDCCIFILKGYAGTGKTTLMRFLIKELKKEKHSFKLLAPTGRAAKVLSNICDTNAETIHSMIYTFTDLNKDLSDVKSTELNIDDTGQLYLNFEAVTVDADNPQPILYIVDESSMVSDSEDRIITQARFGSGKLLSELLNFDKRPDSKFIFVGDPCQLPPIQEVQSPALDTNYFMRHFNMIAKEQSLTDIFRQESGSSLIPASQHIRELCEYAPENEMFYRGGKSWGRVQLRYCKETCLHMDLEDMTDEYVNIVKKEGYNSAIFITMSNRKCAQISSQIRNKLGFFDSNIEKGDLLMVIQNNFPTGLMNGDMVEVDEVQHDRTVTRAGLTFVPVKVRELFTNRKVSILLLTDTLYSGTLNLDSYKQTALFIDFVKRMKKKNITQKKNKKLFKEALRKDPFLNALRCNFGYAVTCHKAQGGEWDNVFVDISNMLLNPTKSKYQWIYTAVTRTRKFLHLLNKPYIS